MTREERNKIFLSAECAKKGNNSYLRQLQNGLIYIEFATLRAGTPRFVGRGCEVSPIPKTKHHEVTAFLQKIKKEIRKMKIFLMLDPPRTTAQMQKVTVVNNKPRFYKPANVRKARDSLIKHLRPFKPSAALEGPIELNVSWLFPKGRHKAGEWKVTKPDTDNLQKMLKDCMTEVGFWKDDAQVVKETCEKRWSDEPVGISIEVNILPKIMEDKT